MGWNGGGIKTCKIMIELKQTCAWCPEQYDAYSNGKIVGYLRLRSGRFTVECPHVMGKLEFSHEFEDSRNEFDEAERDLFLQQAIKAIQAFYN